MSTVPPVNEASITSVMPMRSSLGLALYGWVLAALLVSWAASMTFVSGWPWFEEHWQMSLTMVLGSFVAGSTPAGGASVAFPVFTKLLAIDSHAVATFGLMIQAVGMSMAGVFIVARGIPLYTTIVRWGAMGGSVGVLLGLVFLRVPAPYPKLLFSALVFTFAIALWRARGRERRLSGVRDRDRWRFVRTGVVGGLLASQTGSGADMLIFMVMMIAYRLDGKRAIPTCVCIMAIVSIVGSLGVFLMPHREIGVVWCYWAVCVPVVAIGAPLGAYVISKVPHHFIMVVVMALIAVEVISTLFLIPMTPPRLAFVLIILLVAGTAQWRLHAIRALA